MKKIKQITIYSFTLVILASCGGGGETEVKDKVKIGIQAPKEEKPAGGKNIGIGPVSEATIGDLDQALADEGTALFDQYCKACHKIEEKFIGPALKGVTDRREPEWIMNMILNPEEMIKKDPIAKKLFVEANMAPMANQNLTKDQARAIYEYFRTL